MCFDVCKLYRERFSKLAVFVSFMANSAIKEWEEFVSLTVATFTRKNQTLEVAQG
jgi:hypothetical protein